MTPIRRTPSGVVATLVLAALAFVACAGPAASSPLGSGAPASGASIDRAEAVRRVLAEDPRFAEIGPRDPNLIGQSAWYETVETDDGWQVRVWMGWGDCPAGCIDHHTWTYRVSTGGLVELVAEEGDPLPPGDGDQGGAAGELRGMVTAGPTCPVLTDPPDPDCADRPVAGATLLVVDAADRVVARITTDAAGRFSATLAPGAYRLVPQPVPGLLGTAEAQDLLVGAGKAAVELRVTYDTGIR